MSAFVTTSSGVRIDLPFRTLASFEDSGALVVLLDPDAYVSEPKYREQRRAGAASIRNLRAFSVEGGQLWEAELPEVADYYYRVHSVSPLVVSSFSSYRCTIDRASGTILSKEFFK